MEFRSLAYRMIENARKVWRLCLRVGQQIRDIRDRGLLSSRLRWRRRFSKSNNVFPALSPLDVPVLVINLKKRPDRLREVRANLAKYGFTDIRIVNAVDGPQKHPQISRGNAANLGCTESHLAAVVDNLQPGQPVAVCEDDNEFLGSPEEIHSLISDFLGSPDFDVLCLSARVRGEKVQASESFRVTAWAMAPAFYIAKPRARKPLMGAYRKSIRRLSAQRRRGPFDQVWQTIQRYRLIFVTPVKRVARQKESHSDIQGKFYAGT